MRAPIGHPLRFGNSRLLLIAGFGGLLLLLASAGINAVQGLHQMQRRDDEIRRDFLARNRLLNQIRSDLYLSGTNVRDYLLEPEPQVAEHHLDSLQRSRREMASAQAAYEQLLSVNEAGPYRTLQRELAQYWRSLEPVMHWNAAQRRAEGYAFLRDEVFPRRTAVLHIADQIAAVNEQQLSAGNEQMGTLFAQFRDRLSLALLITLGLGLLLAAFSTTRILRLERESSTRFAEIEQARAELKELSARLVEAQESERRAISRELHDEVGQSLSALLVGLSNLTAALPATLSAELRDQLAALRKLAESTVGVVRNITLLLRPSMLDDLGLVPALQWQAREVSKRTGMLVNLAADGVSDDLPEQYKTCIYRVVQEALNNCARHAQARSVRITVRQEGARIMISIQDDGKGFRPEIERGIGILGMQERVTHLNGTLEVKSEPGHGTFLAIVLPLDPKAVAATKELSPA